MMPISIEIFPVFFIFSLIFVDLQKFGGDFRLALNIRLKYGNFEQDLNKHIDGFECVNFVLKSKKASVLLAFFVCKSA